MRISDLKTFVTLADLGKFKTAADELNITQPALSRRLQKLEEYIGTPLFERSTRSVRLTPIGREFLFLARHVVLDAENAIDTVRAQFSRRGGTLKLACLPSLCTQLMPLVLDDFRSKYPSVKIKLLDGNMTDVIDDINRCIADIGLGMMPHQQAELIFIPLYTEPLLAVFNSNHKLANKALLDAQDLKQYPLVSNPLHSGNRYILQMQLHGKQLEPNWFHEARTLTGVLSLISTSDAIAILPVSTASHMGIDHLISKPIRGIDLKREIGIIHRKDSLFTTYNDYFVGLIKQASKTIISNIK